MWTVYLLTFPDKKIYVGCTKNLKLRMSRHYSNVKGYERAGRHLSAVQQAFKKFGEGVQLQVLTEVSTEGEARFHEELFIVQLKATDPSIGYNESLGIGRLGMPHSSETKAKQSQAASGPSNPAWGRYKKDGRWHYPNKA